VVPRNCILVADDNAAVRHSLRRAFEQAGWEVCGEAATGSEAIAKTEALRPQLVVLDLGMPEMNGITAARILKRKMPDVHLILFTMYGDVLNADDAKNAGLSAVFSKTDPITSLLDKAQSLVARNAA
jgi:DNA-binding NarL/FixJ family response regulator